MPTRRCLFRIVARSSGAVLLALGALFMGAAASLQAQRVPPLRTSFPSGSGASTGQDKPVQKPQVYSGTIVKDGSAFVLHASSGGIYRLDDQVKAARYENKSVRVTGRLDETTKLLQVESISEMGS